MIFLSYVYFSFLCLLPLGSTVWHKHPKLLCFLIESKKKPIYYNSFWGMCVRWGRGKGRYKNKERLSHFQGIYFSYLRRNVASYSFSSILKKKKNWALMRFGPGGKMWCYICIHVLNSWGASMGWSLSQNCVWNVCVTLLNFSLLLKC